MTQCVIPAEAKNADASTAIPPARIITVVRCRLITHLHTNDLHVQSRSDRRPVLGVSILVLAGGLVFKGHAPNTSS